MSARPQVEHLAAHPEVRDRALLVGGPEDIVPDRLGPGLPFVLAGPRAIVHTRIWKLHLALHDFVERAARSPPALATGKPRKEEAHGYS